MKKHGSLLAIILALTVCLCGCGNVDGVTSVSSEGAPEQTSSISSKVTENSSDVSEVSRPESADSSEFPSKCNIYKQTAVQFTDEQLLERFARFPEYGEPQKSPDYPDRLHYYEANGCSGFVSDGDNFNFRTDKGNLFLSDYYYLSELDDGDPNQKYLSADGELDFASRDKALENIRAELADSFGIMPEEWYASKFYAVKKEAVEAYKQKLYRDAYEPEKVYENDDLEKEKQAYERNKDLPAEDFYYIQMKYKVDDIPIFPEGVLDIGASGAGRGVSGTISFLVYTASGLEYIEISPAYETDLSDVQQAELIPADEARGLIQKKYDELITDSVPEVYDMKLMYLPIPQNDLGEYSTRFELRPYYVFYAKETREFDGETFDYTVVTYFDAVTGIELASQKLSENGGMMVVE